MEPLTRPVAAAGADPHGWRVVLGRLLAAVEVGSLARALEVAAAAHAACGDDADAHLRTDLRPDRVGLSLGDTAQGAVTARDVALAGEVTAAVRGLGLDVLPPTGVPRPVQQLEIAVDALDIPAVRPFWAAVLGLVDERPGGYPADPGGGLVDPAGQLPSVWFQQMDAPRPQRNRLHLDIVVAHDEAPARVRAALDAGGVLVSDAAARAFWVLADAEGNEVCVCTWQDRDQS